MGDHRRLKDVRTLHPQTIEEVSRVPVYYPFEWEGMKMRVVPADDEKWGNPCKSCKYLRQRNTRYICPMVRACMANYRRDRKSVKFIGDELSNLNTLPQIREASEKADAEALTKDERR